MKNNLNKRHSVIKEKTPHLVDKYEKNIEILANYIKINMDYLDIPNTTSSKNASREEISLSQKDIPKIPSNEINNKTIQYILSKKYRTNDELLIIKTFLSNLKFMENLCASNKISNDKLLSSLSLYLKIIQKPMGSIIFKYGDKGTRFFIILDGEISVLIIKETKVKIFLSEYIKHLLLLKIQKEDELVKRTLLANSKSKFNINEKEFEDIYDNINNFVNKYYTIRYEDSDEHTNNVIKKIHNSICIENKNINNDILFSNINKYKRKVNNSSNKLLFMKKHLKVDSSNKNKHEKRYSLVMPSNSNLNEIQNNSNELKENGLLEKIAKLSQNLPKRSSEIFDFYNFKVKKLKNSVISYVPKNNEINYKELNIRSLKPNVVEKIVSFFISMKEYFNSFTNKVSSIEDYIKYTYINKNSISASNKYNYTFSNYINKNTNVKNNSNLNETVIIYEYFEITKKNKGEVFGELALQHADNKRTATTIAKTDCILGYLSNEDYDKSLKISEFRKRRIEVNFIMSFAIFNSMNWILFEKSYFNYFKKEKFSYGQIIITQNEEIDNIYFIMEGQFEITANLSYNEINYIIENKTIKSIPKFNKINNNSNKNNDLKKNINKNFTLNNKLKDIKKIFRISLINNKDILGLEDGVINNKSFFTATCVSSSATAFILKKSILNELKNKITQVEKNLNTIVNIREKFIIERLTTILNNLFSFVNEKIKKTDFNEQILNIFQSRNGKNILTDDNKIINKSAKYPNILINKEIYNKNFINDKKNEFGLTTPNKKISSAINSNNNKSAPKKSNFQLFLKSATGRFNQIAKQSCEMKFSHIFSPIVCRTSKNLRNRNNSNKKNKQNYTKKKFNFNFRLKLKKRSPKHVQNTEINENNSDSLSPPDVTNISYDSFNIKSKNNNIYNKTYTSSFLYKPFIKYNIVSDNIYENEDVKIIYDINQMKNINVNMSDPFTILSKQPKSKKNLIHLLGKRQEFDFGEQLLSNYGLTQIEFERNTKVSPIKYMKKILGSQYKEYEISKEKRKFSKLLVKNKNKILRNFNSEEKKNNLHNKKNYKILKPSEVDLLFYNDRVEKVTPRKKIVKKDKIITKKDIYFRNSKKNFKKIENMKKLDDLFNSMKILKSDFV